MSTVKLLLVGDNPFHGISHLSQERATSRGEDLANPSYTADLVMASAENGADGFMFTVSEITLSILERLSKREGCNPLQLYAIVPYAYEFVRLATSAGGVPGLAKELAKQIILSKNLKSIMFGMEGVLGTSPSALMKTYLVYEIYRLKSAVGRKAILSSLLLHEIVTDMALALNLEWLFKTHIQYMIDLGIKPGFETRNFSYLVKRFEEWEIDFHQVVIAAPFNRLAFQMCPSKEESERALAKTSEAEVIAFSILAAGRLQLPEAIEYVANLPNLTGVAVGVSKKSHTYETFKLLKERLKN
ncbi:MAG: hypothetical protein WCD72_04325 [Dehalococcoidia bacterium]